jgi:hypothetical protein
LPGNGSGATGTVGPPSNSPNAGLNNSVSPNGIDNSGGVSVPPPGTNSAGTANSSGSSVTTGAAGPRAKGDSDIAIEKEDKQVDSKIKSICRGC